MQLWFAHGGDVPIREQLVTQVILGILSDDLAPGQRLPSTRELARRFHVHPNTISAGYRQLERERWVEFRRGRGVYVRARKPESMPPRRNWPASLACHTSRPNSTPTPAQWRPESARGGSGSVGHVHLGGRHDLS